MKATFFKLKEFFLSVLISNSWSDLYKADVLVVRHDVDCGYQYKGMAYSPIVDSIVEICVKEGLSVLSVATPYSRLGRFKAFNNPLILNRKFFVIAVISRLLALFVGKVRSEQWAVSKRAAVWQKVLERVQPKLIVGVQPDLGLCRASRMQGVPVYDYQHGVIENDWFWYDTRLKNVAVSDLPTGFLCWDARSAASLQSWALAKGVTVDVLGNPWFQRFQFQSEQDRLVLDALQNGRIYTNSKPTILVSLQWGLHIHYYNNSDFNKVMCSALETVIKRTCERYNWLLRLHPVQVRGSEGAYCEHYLSSEFGECAGVEWRRTTFLPLPIVLTQCDIHITDMSTVVIEAAWMGIPSALLNPHLNQGGKIEGLYEHERNIGIAQVLTQNVAVIESWIEDKLVQKKEASGDIMHSEVFCLWLKEKMVTN